MSKKTDTAKPQRVGTISETRRHIEQLKEEREQTRRKYDSYRTQRTELMHAHDAALHSFDAQTVAETRRHIEAIRDTMQAIETAVKTFDNRIDEAETKLVALESQAADLQEYRQKFPALVQQRERILLEEANMKSRISSFVERVTEFGCDLKTHAAKLQELTGEPAADICKIDGVSVDEFIEQAKQRTRENIISFLL